MRFEQLAALLKDSLAYEHVVCMAIGVFGGAVTAGVFLSLVMHRYSRKLFRWRVLDEVRREMRGPLLEYVDWLHAVSAESSAWKGSLVQNIADRGDLHEVNRLRRLFLDVRSHAWFDRLEEYEAVLGRFRSLLRELWTRHTRVQEHFHSLLRLLEHRPAEAAEFGRILEKLAFEQSQLVSNFLYRLQHECLKAVADSQVKVPRPGKRAPILQPNSLGRVRVIAPAAESAMKS